MPLLYSTRPLMCLKRTLFTRKSLPTLQLTARFNSFLSSSRPFSSLSSRRTSINLGFPTTMKRGLVTPKSFLRDISSPKFSSRSFSTWLSSPPKPPSGINSEKDTSNKLEMLKRKVEEQNIRARDVINELDVIVDEQRQHTSNSRADLLQARLDESRRDKDKLAGSANKSSRFLWVLLGGGLCYFLWSKMNKEEGIFQDNFQEIHPPGSEETRLMRYKQKQIELDVKDTHVTFNDIKGNEDAKEELQDLVDYLQDPSKYHVMGLDLPKGVLLDGPPGTGKTLMARALAGEAGVPFIAANGSGFVQIFAGLGAQRVRKLFARAREIAPCIVFIDEIDAIGSRRDTPQNYSKQTLNQLLGEMDGFAINSGVIVVAATNLASSLDPALVRPGRFDRKVRITLPDKKIRREIIELYLKDNAASDVDTMLLADSTTGMTGSDLKQLVNRAGIETVKKNLKKITMAALIEAQETLLMGRSNNDMVISKETMKTVAYHEAGHALVAIFTPGSPPIYKATVLPRGGALGFVAYTPKDEHLKQKKSYLAQMDVCMGGRAAEEIIMGKDKVTQGASNDFQQASAIARNMVTRLGMSESVGKVYHTEDTLRKLSPHERQRIDNEIREMVDSSFDRAKKLLIKHQKEHHILAQALLEDETLSIEEIKKRINFKEESVEK